MTDEMRGLRLTKAKAPYMVRKLDEPCPFCLRSYAHLWRDPADDWKPFQVRCEGCGARGPACDCGEESAVPTWLSVKPRALLAQERTDGL